MFKALVVENDGYIGVRRGMTYNQIGEFREREREIEISRGKKTRLFVMMEVCFRVDLGTLDRYGS